MLHTNNVQYILNTNYQSTVLLVFFTRKQFNFVTAGNYAILAMMDDSQTAAVWSQYNIKLNAHSIQTIIKETDKSL